MWVDKLCGQVSISVLQLYPRVQMQQRSILSPYSGHVTPTPVVTVDVVGVAAVDMSSVADSAVANGRQQCHILFRINSDNMQFSHSSSIETLSTNAYDGPISYRVLADHGTINPANKLLSFDCAADRGIASLIFSDQTFLVLDMEEEPEEDEEEETDASAVEE